MVGYHIALTLRTGRPEHVRLIPALSTHEQFRPLGVVGSLSHIRLFRLSDVNYCHGLCAIGRPVTGWFDRSENLPSLGT